MSAPIERGPGESTSAGGVPGDGGVPSTRAEGARRARQKRREMASDVRTADLEPYLGLRYLSKLFRLLAIVLLILLVAEVATGLIQQGADAIATLVAESSRLIVLAGLLWGIGDLVLLLIDVGHDVRAGRILLGRQVAHLAQEASGGQPARADGAPDTVGVPHMAGPPPMDAADEPGTTRSAGSTGIGAA
jgi:hypothetical protein